MSDVTIEPPREREGRPAGHAVPDTLESRMAVAGGAMPLDAVVHLLAAVARELDNLAATGVCYGAVSPSTIELDPEGQPRLLTPDRVDGLRRGYLAPEQRHGEPNDATVDQYALAIVAYELISGHRRESRLVGGELDSVNEVEVGPERVLRPGLNPAVNGAIRRALGRTAANRWPTSSAFVEALAAAVDAPPPRPTLPNVEVIDARAHEIRARAKPAARRRAAPGGGLLAGSLMYALAAAVVIAGAWAGTRWPPSIWGRLWNDRSTGPTAGEQAAERLGSDPGTNATSGGAAAASDEIPAALLGFVRVRAPGNPLVLLDGRPIGTGAALVRATAGLREIEVREEGRAFSPAVVRVLVTAGDTVDAVFGAP